MGMILAKTGILFPFFSPILGWLGVFITGSDTSSNLLFGNMQQVTANSNGSIACSVSKFFGWGDWKDGKNPIYSALRLSIVFF